jgi:CheY-like chemotaxis protein
MSTVLIVDDSNFQRSLIGSIAEEAGLEVLATDNGREGLAAVIQHEPDCIITDLLMPEMNGLDMIEALQEEGWNTPFIVVSADVQDTTRARAEQLGVASFLGKPVRRASVIEALATSFDGAAASPSIRPSCSTRSPVRFSRRARVRARTGSARPLRIAGGTAG